MQPSTVGEEFCWAPSPALPKPTARSLVTAHRLRPWAWAPGTRHPGHEPQTRAPARVSTGAAGRPAAILLHGWPYDIYSFADVTSALASAGYRIIVPFVRGYGTTRFLSDG